MNETHLADAAFNMYEMFAGRSAHTHTSVEDQALDQLKTCLVEGNAPMVAVCKRVLNMCKNDTELNPHRRYREMGLS